MTYLTSVHMSRGEGVWKDFRDTGLLLEIPLMVKGQKLILNDNQSYVVEDSIFNPAAKTQSITVRKT